MLWSGLLPGLAAVAQGPGLAPRSDAVVKRDVAAGGKCGTQANNAICASSLCCSQDGVCGTGEGFCSAPACQISAGPACDGNQTPSGKDTTSVPRPLFGNVPYGVDISHCSVNGKVAITFDDGPYLYTSDLLDILKANNVRATFFVVGNNGAKGMINSPSGPYPAILRRMIEDGHQVGSHTWSHQDLSNLTAQQRKDQIVKNEIALNDILGFFPTYLRPPYTRWNQDALNDLKTYGYHVLNYDIDTRDWQGDYNYARNTYSTILSQHSPASSSWISLEHDIYNQTVHGFVQFIIDTARKLNYTLVTVGDCLGDPPSNWYRNSTTGQPYTAASFKEAGPGASSSASPAPTGSDSPSAAPSSTSTFSNHSAPAVTGTGNSTKPTGASPTSAGPKSTTTGGSKSGASVGNGGGPATGLVTIVLAAVALGLAL